MPEWIIMMTIYLFKWPKSKGDGDWLGGYLLINPVPNQRGHQSALLSSTVHKYIRSVEWLKFFLYNFDFY